MCYKYRWGEHHALSIWSNSWQALLSVDQADSRISSCFMRFKLAIFSLSFFKILSCDQGTLEPEKGCAEMCNFHMAALMFLTGHWLEARIYACVEITRFSSRCIIRTWKALGLWPHASQALMMHLIGKCAISAWAWCLAI